MKLKKFGKFIALTSLVTLLYGCGGGNSGGDIFSEYGLPKPPPNTETIAVKFEASTVKGITVCNDSLDGEYNCSVTNSNGIANIKISALESTFTLDFKIGDIDLGTVSAYTPPYDSSNKGYTATPMDIVVADLQSSKIGSFSDIKHAAQIGAFLHALAGDTNDNSSIDLTEKTIVDYTIISPTENPNNIYEYEGEPFYELLGTANLEIYVRDPNGSMHTILSYDNGTIKYDNKTVKYNLYNVPEVQSRYGTYLGLINFLKDNNGKQVMLSKDNSTCTLEVNSSDSIQLKLDNCSNPNDDDVNWESVNVDQAGNLLFPDNPSNPNATVYMDVVDENDNLLYRVISVKNNKIHYKVKNQDGSWSDYWMTVQ